MHLLLRAARKDAEDLAVDSIGFVHVNRGQKLQIESGAASQLLRQGLEEVHAHADAAGLGGDYQSIVHLVGGEREIGAEDVVLFVGVAAVELGHQVPLLGGRHEAHIAVGGNAFAMKDHLQSGIFLVDKDRVEGVAVEHHVEPLRAQVIVIDNLHREIRAACGQRRS